MNVGIGNQAAQFHFWEYINWIFGTVYCTVHKQLKSTFHRFSSLHYISARVSHCNKYSFCFELRTGFMIQEINKCTVHVFVNDFEYRRTASQGMI
jgi:hypothetical protein